ncbi:MAG: L-threonylcarbamoyladenylate synthase [Pseudomonadales bacterium]|nr:threonylcarbamoyl-AMP synthase [Pseudomonadales bacterium]
MSQYFSVHPTHPQSRLLSRAAEILSAGGLVVFPTDTAYALGCHIGDKQALERIRKLRKLDKHHHLTLMCRDLSEISLYARVDDANYRILKHLTPGPFTFLLPATREVPRRLVHPKRRTIGLRVPSNPIILGLLEALGEPIMSTTLRLPDAELPLVDPEEIRSQLERQVDLVIDGGPGGLVATTIVDLTRRPAEIIRQGLGEFE